MISPTANAWVESVVNAETDLTFASKEVLEKDVVPLPETVEEQTAWDVANILRDLPSGAPLSRLGAAYKIVYSRYDRCSSGLSGAA